jgi:hypothetical protein
LKLTGRPKIEAKNHRGFIMKICKWSIVLLIPWMQVVHAQFDFDAGSDGSYGPIQIDESTELALQPDGIFHATTVTVAQGATLTFTPNALNTPVYLLAVGDIIIEGTIDISGQAGNNSVGGAGGPGGFPGGSPSIAGSGPGDGAGPGGGRGGLQSSADPALQVGRGVYGDQAINPRPRDGLVYSTQLMMPMVGGSGGGGFEDSAGNGFGGSGGGGAILLASNTRIAIAPTGAVRSHAGNSNYGRGSGGAIRLLAPIVEGDGIVSPCSHSSCGVTSAGGPGRVRVDTIDRSGLSGLNHFGTGPLTVSSFMKTFPDVSPRLDIVDAAGTPIPLDTDQAVTVILPFDAPAEQTVTVRAEDFGPDTTVPIRVVAIPDAGDSIIADVDIAMGGQSVATQIVDLVLPLNVPVRLFAWTRDAN